jgi:hypothetical protein
MLWLARTYLQDVARDDEVLSLEPVLGALAIGLALLTGHLGSRAGKTDAPPTDRVGPWLFAFLAVCITGELLRADRELGHISTFVSIGAYYLVGRAVGSWFAREHALMPVLPSLLTVYTLWYVGLFAFYVHGDLGFFGELPDSHVPRLEFRSGFTATELPIYVGFQLPVLGYALLAPHGAALRLWALVLFACGAALIYLSASVAALTALLLVTALALMARRGLSLTVLVRIAFIVGAAGALLLVLTGEIVEATEEKLLAFVSSEGIRALIYAELLSIIDSEPFGIGKSRFVLTNSFSWLGEGVFPHNNVLGIGAELGVAAMLLFVMVCLVAAVSLSKFALLRRPEVSTRTRLLVSVALGIFVYQQFRGLLQDTWVFRETYFWLGAGMSVVLASGTGRRRPSS